MKLLPGAVLLLMIPFLHSCAQKDQKDNVTQQNVELVRGMYDAFGKGDIPAVLAVLDPQVVWNEAENFPYADGNPYVGPTAVVEGVFKRLGDEWEYWTLNVEQVLGAQNDMVVVLGRYNAKYKQTGALLDAQFAHIWSLNNGKVVKFQQYADTEQATRIVRGL